MSKDICKILETSKTIAVIGLSSNPTRTSRVIVEYLRKFNYNVIGVNPNPNFTDANGIKVYNSLEEISQPIDIVNVFRKSEDIPFIIDDVINSKPNVLWLQLGIRNDEAVKPIVDSGIITIQNKCIKIEHSYCN